MKHNAHARRAGVVGDSIAQGVTKTECQPGWMDSTNTR